MAARLTDQQKKKIVADYTLNQNYSAVAKINGVSRNTVKAIVRDNADIAEICQQKKEQNTADMLAFMDSRKARMQEAIDLHLTALTDMDKIDGATLAQIATSFGILVDKATKNTASSNDSIRKLDDLLREFQDAVKQETT